MRLPETPKSVANLLHSIPPQRFVEVMSLLDHVSKDDVYLHWNEVRRRPAPLGLSHEEWWLLLKMGRKMRFINLTDKKGNPFRFMMPDQVAANLHQIDLGLGSSWSLPDAVTNPASRNEYVISTLIQEAITSSQLEGAVTTREVAKEMLRTGREPRDKSERMILNNYRTMQRIMDLRQGPLTPDIVLELHRIVTEGTLERDDAAGRFRRLEETVCVSDMEENVFHDPPPAAELPDRMARMCAFANGTEPSFFIHPVIRAILLHFWLAYDHPFVDGNGRTARALFYWSMLQQGFQLFEFISISQILLKAPAQYYTAFLHVETDDNDLTYFILHQTAVIQKAVQALHEYVERKKAALLVAEHRMRGIEGLNHRQQVLLTHALKEPGARYQIEAHRRTHGIVYQTARTDLLDLVKRGLLTQDKSRRTLVFYPLKDLSKKLETSAAKEQRTSGYFRPVARK
jgi:Fic family protein